MADEQNLELNPATDEGSVGAAPISKVRKAAVARKTGARATRADIEQAGSVPSNKRSRRYSASEKSELLDQIEAQIANGSTLKAAAKGAGISEQTYYQWKRAASAKETGEDTGTETLADLIKLETENKRLRELLAEKLRAENADLRKRLGMD